MANGCKRLSNATKYSRKIVVSSDPRKYLIVGPSWVGDMVMAQSLLLDIKQREPKSRIDMLAPQWCAALTDRMPQVDTLIATNLQHGKLGLGERWRLAKSLASKNYSHAIVLPNSLKSALVPAMARIPKRVGFVGEQRWGLLNDVRRLDKKRLPMTVQRFVALGRKGQDADQFEVDISSITSPSLIADTSNRAKALQEFGLSDTAPVLVVCPGAEFGVSKQWPLSYFGELANEYLKQSWQVWLMGSESDNEACEKINALTENQCHNLAGNTSLPQAVDLMSLAKLVVSNDSGLMHIAAALHVPLVAIYGSTDPGHTPPLSDNHAIAQYEIDCSPCFKRDCPLQHHECMTKLLPSRVIELSKQLLV